MEMQANMELLYARIREMDEEQLRRVVWSTIKRYAELFPQEEVIVLSLPKDNIQERNRILEDVRSMRIRMDQE